MSECVSFLFRHLTVVAASSRYINLQTAYSTRMGFIFYTPAFVIVWVVCHSVCDRFKTACLSIKEKAVLYRRGDFNYYKVKNMWGFIQLFKVEEKLGLPSGRTSPYMMTIDWPYTRRTFYLNLFSSCKAVKSAGPWRWNSGFKSHSNLVEDHFPVKLVALQGLT